MRLTIPPSENLEPLEEVRRRATVAEPFIETVCTGPLERAGGFDTRATGVPSGRLCSCHQHPADAVAAVRLVDHEGGDPAPRTAVVGHRHEEVRGGPDKRPSVVGHEHVRPRIGEHVFQRTA